MENKIIFTTEGNVTPADIETLKQNGVIVIQVKDLLAIQTVNDFDNDIVLEAAMETLSNAYGEKSKFFDKFFVKYFANKKKTQNNV